MRKIIVLGILCVCGSAMSYAQHAGDLDSSFGTKGIVRTDFGASGNIYGAYGRQLLTQGGGSFYLVFTTNEQTLITRFFTDGSIDRSYGDNGYSHVITGNAVIQADGKIIVAGANKIARYNANGSPDNTFGRLGTIISMIADINAAAIESNGKIVVAGFNNLARYNPDGTPDNTFKGNVSTGEGPSIAIQKNGKIIVFGTFRPLSGSVSVGKPGNNDGDYRSYATLSRLNVDGGIDSTFGKNGKSDSVGSYSIANSVAIQSDGKILVVDDNTPALARYKADGSFDSSFAGDGIAGIGLFIGGEAQPLAIESDGKILVAGDVTSSDDNVGEDFAVVRYNTDGTPDNTFASKGKQSTDFKVYDFVSAVAIQSNGKIVVTGSVSDYNTLPDFALARYNPEGGLDTSFSHDGKLSNYTHTGYTSYNSGAIQKDGKIVVAGVANTGIGKDFAIARYDTDGTADTTFSGDGKHTTHFKNDDEVHSVFIQNDGKIVVAGISNITNNFPQQNKFTMVRYNADGSTDSTFSVTGNLPTAAAFSNIGQVVATGDSNGKIVVALSGGSFYSPVYILARYNHDGSPDNSFAKVGFRMSSFKADYQDAQSIAIQRDGKIVVAGSTGSYPDYYFAVARYNTDGTLDATFSGDGMQTTDFGSVHVAKAKSVAIQEDGKIVLAGAKQQADGNEFFAVARYNADGSADTTFSGDGKQSVSFEPSDGASSLAVQNDGKIVLAGNSNGSFAIARLNTNGSLDTSFGGNGKRITEVSRGNNGINDIVISGNKLYGVGFAQTPGNIGIVARYLLNEIVPALLSNRPSFADIKTNLSSLVTLQLAPNPSHNILNIYTTGLFAAKEQTISIISASGMVVKTMRANLSKVISLDVSSIPAGVYTIKMFNGSGIISKQFIKL